PAFLTASWRMDAPSRLNRPLPVRILTGPRGNYATVVDGASRESVLPTRIACSEDARSECGTPAARRAHGSARAQCVVGQTPVDSPGEACRFPARLGRPARVAKWGTPMPG